jgi:hypothetical protein
MPVLHTEFNLNVSELPQAVMSCPKAVLMFAPRKERLAVRAAY